MKACVCDGAQYVCCALVGRSRDGKFWYEQQIVRSLTDAAKLVSPGSLVVVGTLSVERAVCERYGICGRGQYRTAGA